MGTKRGSSIASARSIAAALLATIVAVFFICSVKAIDVQPDQVKITGPPGESAAWQLIIENPSNISILASLPSIAKFNGHQVSINHSPASPVQIEANTSININYSLTIPKIKAGTYLTTLNFTASDGSSDSLELVLNISPAPMLSMDSLDLVAVLGKSVSSILHIRNTGNIPLNNINLAPTDLKSAGSIIPSSSVKINETLFSIGYSEEKNITISINTSGAQPGIYQGSIIAAFENKTSNTTIILSILSPVYDIAVMIPQATLIKSSETNISSDTVTFTIQNIGNVELTNISIVFEDLLCANNTIPKSFILNNEITIPKLLPGQEYSKAITVTLPSQQQPTGLYIGAVNIESAEGLAKQYQFKVLVRGAKKSLDAPIAITVGSQAQQRSEFAEAVFELKNSGDYDISNITLEFYGKERYNVTIEPSIIDMLALGETKQITVKAFVPKEQDSGIDTIGSIKIDADGLLKTITLRLETASALVFEDLDITVDGSADKNLQDEGYGYVLAEEAKPGSIVEISMQLKNAFERSARIDIEDITIEVSLDIDAWDFDSSIEKLLPKIRSGRKSKRLDFEFRLPYEIEPGEYNLTIAIEGSDENGAQHSIEKEFVLKVDKEPHDIKIISASLGKRILGCGDKTKLKVKVMNIGLEDEPDSLIKIRCQELNISYEKELDLDADPDSENEATVFFDIKAGEFPAGEYQITVQTFYEDEEPSDKLGIKLQLLGCAEFEELEYAYGEFPDDYYIDTVSEQVSYEGDDTFYTALLVLGYIAVIGLLLALILKVRR